MMDVSMYDWHRGEDYHDCVGFTREVPEAISVEVGDFAGSVESPGRHARYVLTLDEAQSLRDWLSETLATTHDGTDTD